MIFPKACFGMFVILLVWAGPARAVCRDANPETLIADLRKAWAAVSDYRNVTEILESAGSGPARLKKFVYTFKKPNLIRIRMETPETGTILVYPDENGKVAVRPSGLFGLMDFHLDPGHRRLKTVTGQRLDQTDVGQLIDNMALSFTSRRLSPVMITEGASDFWVEVTAANHFRPESPTEYRLRIDKRLCLPVEVHETIPALNLRRTIVFRDLEINRGVKNDYFNLDMEE